MSVKPIRDFEEILERALNHEQLDQRELETLLCASGTQRELLYETARKLRDEHFHKKLFGYGFVYFSTHCRNNCTFCFYRRENQHALRYRKTREEILRMADGLTESGVHLLDFTMGEDPQYVTDDAGYQMLMDTATEMRARTGLATMFSLGLLPERMLQKAGAGGIEFYACYQETHNRALFAELRQGQDYSQRFRSKLHAQQAGMLTEEGILVGVGESIADIAHSILTMKNMGAAQVRVMSFVPQNGAPLQRSIEDGLYDRELNTLAVMRVAMPDRFIPASLDIAGKAGLKERLDAGANIVTSIIVPDSGFAGVSNATLDVDNGSRSLPGIQDTVEECGLSMGSHAEFTQAINTLHEDCTNADRDYWRQATGS